MAVALREIHLFKSLPSDEIDRLENNFSSLEIPTWNGDYSGRSIG
jgi:hypothetical protein